MRVEVETVVPGVCLLGEAPRWSDGRLWWVDVRRGGLHAFDPTGGVHTTPHRVKPPLCACVPAARGLLLFGDGSIERWDGESSSPVRWGGAGRFNDATVDARGRVIAGTVANGEQPGRLYLIEAGGGTTVLRDGLAMPNGLAFVGDDRLVFVDTTRRALLKARYDLERGRLEEPTVLAEHGQAGYPDGLAPDTDGGVWCASWGEGAVVRYAADGAISERLALPVRNVSALAFGGERLDELYITTGAHPGEPLGGALFRAKVPYRGRAIPPALL